MRLTVPRYLRPVLVSLAGLGVLLYLAGPGSTQPAKGEKREGVGKTTYDRSARPWSARCRSRR